jgi:hypothetical protein
MATDRQDHDEQEQQLHLLAQLQSLSQSATNSGRRLVMAGNTVGDATALAGAAYGGPDSTKWIPEQALRHLGDVATADTILEVSSTNLSALLALW